MTKDQGQRTRDIQAVVFDLDGLMFNTEAVFHRTGHELLRRRGKVMTRELTLRMMGRRPHEAFEAMIEVTGIEDSIHDLWSESQVIFQEFAVEHLAPMPGLHALLNAIEAGSLPKAVATSSPRPYMEGILGRFDLLERFHFTLTAEDVTHGKPHPEIYLTAAERLGVEPARMLVLEDSEAGTNSAAAAGAYVVSIPHEHSSDHNFSAATLIADRLDDARLLELIARH